MQIKPGILLISAPSLDDPHFEKVVIFIATCDANGAMGFVINKLFPRRFNELMEFKHARALPLYAGGPVKEEKLFFLHRRPDLIEGGTPVINTIYLGGNFKQAVQLNINHRVPDNDMQLFIGYCGWDEGQLEAEIAEGSWLLFDDAAQYLFKDAGEGVWEEIYKSR